MNLIMFDLDGTLAESKQTVPDEMIQMLSTLSWRNHLAIISGAKFEQFETQLLRFFDPFVASLEKIIVLPTCGAQMYLWDYGEFDWVREYNEAFSPEESEKIIEVIQRHTQSMRICGIRDQIEDRGSQITFSALGQKAHPEVKKLWDPTNEKKMKLRDAISKDLPEFEVRTGGSTSVDVTKKGIDKKYGIQKVLNGTFKDFVKHYKRIIFFGDALYEGGNDHSVSEIEGIECIPVKDWQDTLNKLEEMKEILWK